MTRRVVTVPRDGMLWDLDRAWTDPGFEDERGAHCLGYLHVPCVHPDDGWAKNPRHDPVFRLYCKHELGDHLWVRETWRETGAGQWADGSIPKRGSREHVIYRADGCEWDGPWRSPIYMPRWASRIAIVVRSVRGERLQDIGESDCKAEGIKLTDGIGRPCLSPEAIEALEAGRQTYRRGFANGWNWIHRAKPERRWEADPHVWVITFEVVP